MAMLNLVASIECALRLHKRGSSNSVCSQLGNLGAYTWDRGLSS